MAEREELAGAWGRENAGSGERSGWHDLNRTSRARPSLSLQVAVSFRFHELSSVVRHWGAVVWFDNSEGIRRRQLQLFE